MKTQKTTLETIRIQVVAFVVLAGCALAFGLGRPAPAAAHPIHSAAPVASVAVAEGSFCRLDGTSRCQ